MSTPARSALAVLTPPGRGGIAVLRCVGPGAETAMKACFRPAAKGAPLPEPGRLAYGHVVDADGRALDEIILCCLAPHESASRSTATQRRVAVPPEPAAGAAGDAPPAPIYEVNCHGGPAAVAAVSRRLTELGLEQVDADRLLEIEGVPKIEREARRLLRRARTPLAARILLDQLNGALARAVADIRDDLEAGRLAKARDALDTLLARWRQCGRFLADPPRIAIAGRPNVGKSTLLNHLVGADRAITSPTPGTTRDYVEADAALDGLPAVLVDTAGLCEGRDAVERLGVERTRGELARASLVLFLVDAAEGTDDEDRAMLRVLGPRGLAVWNKVDLAPAEGGAPGISALSGEGVADLTAAVLSRLGYRPVAAGKAMPSTSEQAATLEEAGRLAGEGKADAAREALRCIF